MKCKAGRNWGKNTYTCSHCGVIQNLLTNEEIFKKCICGNDEFDSSIQFERSASGLKKKLDEIIHILEVSIFLCELLNMEEFCNVIAIQLRILLCDNKHIIKTVMPKPMMHPHKGIIFKGTEGFVLIQSFNLFDKEKPEITLDKWLNQEIVWSQDWKKPITIRDMIIAWANKNGGAHVDPIIPEKEFFAIEVAGKKYLLTIARYVVERLDYNLEQDLAKKFFRPYSMLLNSGSK